MEPDRASSTTTSGAGDGNGNGADGLLDRLVAPGGLRAVVQPIVRVADGEVVGYEALSRAVEPEPVEPSAWFGVASATGRRLELERACLRAVADLGDPPDDRLLFVNVSPALVSDPGSAALRHGLPRRLVLELTERDQIEDTAALRVSCEPWLRSGARLAIDDAGAGYSSLKQVVELLPEFVKIDRSLIADIHRDRHRQALVAALVGFASEIGASLIAEGVETAAQLRWLRDADVALAQGFLLGRPGPAWPEPVALGRRAPRTPRLGRLGARLDEATSRRAACETVAAHLFRQGGLLPSVYLEAGGRLRCQAQRGLWQVLDGMVPTAGITGLTYRSGTEQYCDDLTSDVHYLEAVPGVVAEVCVPIRADGIVVGALNVESLVPLGTSVREEVRACADLLGQRLGDLGPELARVPMRRLARTAASLAAVSDAAGTIDAVLTAALELSTMGSAMLVLDAEWSDGERRHATGPLAPALEAMADGELDHLATVLDPLTSCYTAGDVTGRCVTASETLRDNGARSLVALPIAARGHRRGLLVMTDSDPVPLGPEQVEPLELLAVLAGSCLETASTVEELRRQARLDALTGIANHSSFHQRLAEVDRGDGAAVALLMLDIDDFKLVNDTGGHLLGDRLLRTTSDELRRVVPDPEDLYRIGGDEFAVIVIGADADAETVRAVEAAIQRAVAPLLAVHGAALSVGTAHRLGDEPLIATLARADADLYEAKAATTRPLHRSRRPTPARLAVGS